MKADPFNIDDWLHQEAHVAAGRPFRFNNCSCVPVAPETQFLNIENPVGFLVTQGIDVDYEAAQTPDGERLMHVWAKNHLVELTAENESLPAECWYG